MKSTASTQWLKINGLLFLLFFPGAPEPAAALEVPPLTARVNDYANILSESTEQQLEKLLQLFEQKETTQIGVLTIQSLQGDNLERFSIQVVEQWKLGQQKTDNGVLLLIAKEDRKLRIEVGYGLEGKLTDLVSGKIIKHIITPRFREGNFDQGLIDGVNAVMSVVRGEFSDQLAQMQKKNKHTTDRGGIIMFLAFTYYFIGAMLRQKSLLAGLVGAFITPFIGLLMFHVELGFVIFLTFAGFFAGMIISSLISDSAGGSGSGSSYRSSGGFSSGGFSSGGFSGGGGSFGGGGASGSW